MSLRHELETLMFIIIASIIGLFGVFYFRQSSSQNKIYQSPKIPNFVLNTIQSNISPTETPPKTTTTFILSPDGNDKLTLNKTVYSESTYFQLTLTDNTKNTTLTLYSQNASNGANFILPFNAFSSDNSYIFIKEILNNSNHYLVFKSSGQGFDNNQIDLDVLPLFSSYTSTYSISDVTGWSSPTLLIVNTKNTDNSTGPSFWFDTENKTFTQLATQFP